MTPPLPRQLKQVGRNTPASRALPASVGGKGRAGKGAAACGVVAVGLMAGVAFAGDSAAVPGLGASTVLPPWDLGLGLSSATVTVLLLVADLIAAGSLVLGLVWVARGGRIDPRKAAPAAVAATLILVCVPPLGSADHLSYAAYGRIAAAGDDPYVVVPAAWRGGTDPVAGAVQPPWQDTVSVYGPVATGLQALTALAGNGNLRTTVWAWQLIAGAAFGLVGWLLDRLTRGDPTRRTRAAVLWTLNPLLLGELVLGAHLDVVAVAAALAALVVATSGPLTNTRALAGGALLGVAFGLKAPFALTALAVVWGLRHTPRPELLKALGLGGVGGLAVLVPAHLWSGPHTYDQLSQASKFVSLSSPWRLVVDVVDPIWGRPSTRPIVSAIAWVLAVGLAVLLARRLRDVPEQDGTATASANRALLVLAGAWILTVPYALPWYDAMVWAPLALLPATWLDAAFATRLAVLAVAYVPGRVVGLSPRVEDLTLGFRQHVAPWLLLAVLVSVVVWTLRRRELSAAPR